MTFILSLLAFVFTKALSPLGLSFLEPLLRFFESKANTESIKVGHFTTAMTAALEAEVQSRRIASQERIALWGSPLYKALITAIVLPPAAYSALVFGDSIFHWEFYDVDAAPTRFEELGFNILMTFIGASGAVGAVSSLKGVWRK